ncbi:hypothetical protein Lal_00045875 [Lupinus albus]|nr:hypothetical protein Lal_00045875 [Lupinus albus]
MAVLTVAKVLTDDGEWEWLVAAVKGWRVAGVKGWQVEVVDIILSKTPKHQSCILARTRTGACSVTTL